LAQRTRRQEENTKIKIVLPLLQTGLGYGELDEFDFEHNVKNKRADIAIIIDDVLATIIEVKDENEDLDHHIEQAIEYGSEKQLEFVALTNGREFRIYAVFAKGVVSPKDRVIYQATISNPLNPPAKLKELFSRNQLPDFQKLRRQKQKLRPQVTDIDLTRVLQKGTQDLFDILFPQFKRRYRTDAAFRKKLDRWAATVKLDIKESRLVENLCKEGAYSLINRVLFYRISEDRSSEAPDISEANLRKWRVMVEEPSTKLQKLFKNKASEYKNFYDSPLFNSITFDDVEWDQVVIYRVLARFANVDFGHVTDDLLGQAYERHIPEEERKNLGQFYTKQFVIEYLCGQIPITANSLILDPACGSGGFLTHCLNLMNKKFSVDPSKLVESNLFGIDINPFATQLTTMNLLLGTLSSRHKPVSLRQGCVISRGQAATVWF